MEGGVPPGNHLGDIEEQPQDRTPIDFDRTGLKMFSREELKKYDGSDPTLPLLLSINHEVFDVTSGSRFYGPGAHYHVFAGKDSTRAFSLSSLKEQVL